MALGASSAAGVSAGSAQTMNGGINVPRAKEQIIELGTAYVKAENNFQQKKWGFFSKVAAGIISGINWVLNNDSDNSKKESSSGSQSSDDPVEITIDANKHPESARHLDDAIKSGKTNEGVIDRAGAKDRRRENTKNVETKKDKDRDEAPPAVINTGESSSVRHISKPDNRGAGGL
ncbi:hypothetical protein [Empedobacter brevis]|uniref:hypothetical protein n=1 Tax=Empedobacter brevis TaxID=247 RepID=UPI0021A98FC7|nr:hypothetical protein [Empedobacter brevis]